MTTYAEQPQAINLDVHLLIAVTANGRRTEKLPSCAMLEGCHKDPTLTYGG